MASISLSQRFTFELTAVEARLVFKALGGRLVGEEVGAAKALGDSLSVAKAKAIKSMAHENEKLVASLVSAGLYTPATPPKWER